MYILDFYSFFFKPLSNESAVIKWINVCKSDVEGSRTLWIFDIRVCPAVKSLLSSFNIGRRKCAGKRIVLVAEFLFLQY